MNKVIASLLFTIALTIPVTAQKESRMDQEFMGAATKGDVAKVRAMLESNPTLARAKDDKGISVILKATYHGKKDVVAALLETKPELDIFESSATGQTKRVEELVKQNRELANAFAVDGFMPLGLAVFFGHSETVETLLKAGANVNATTRETMKVTPLASAAAARQLGIAKTLIAHGANVNAKAENEVTPLHETAASGNLEFTKLLLEHGAAVNARTTDGKTPLALAIEQNRTEVIELLKSRGGRNK